ncbi:hypothetical protein [Vibrio owensii]|uniref:hypothetical protein n=1 Tax=Vibrio owensii TaxID=696485 RepID=UPI003CC61823
MITLFLYVICMLMILTLVLATIYYSTPDLSGEGRDFRISSFLLMEGNSYKATVVNNKGECELNNRLINSEYMDYELFKNSCDYIFSEASIIHDKFSAGRDMSGVMAFETRGHFRYIPLYKGKYKNLEYANGVAAFSERKMSERAVSNLNRGLKNAGYY